jgi:membrane-associated protease RseP (regulator of RpoE activity)
MTGMPSMNIAIYPVEHIESAILLIRGQKVILDRDLAILYGVETKVLKQAVRRNAKRFPDDFMFLLDNKEVMCLRSQIVTSNNQKRGGDRALPMAFTEQGVAMLSGLLNSDRAVEVNIAIMRAFVKLRMMLVSHEALARKLTEMEATYDKQFKVVFDVLKQLMTPPPAPPKKQIGFGVKETRSYYRVQRHRK